MARHANDLVHGQAHPSEIGAGAGRLPFLAKERSPRQVRNESDTTTSDCGCRTPSPLAAEQPIEGLLRFPCSRGLVVTNECDAFARLSSVLNCRVRVPRRRSVRWDAREQLVPITDHPFLSESLRTATSMRWRGINRCFLDLVGGLRPFNQSCRTPNERHLSSPPSTSFNTTAGIQSPPSKPVKKKIGLQSRYA